MISWVWQQKWEFIRSNIHSLQLKKIQATKRSQSKAKNKIYKFWLLFY